MFFGPTEEEILKALHIHPSIDHHVFPEPLRVTNRRMHHIRKPWSKSVCRDKPNSFFGRELAVEEAFEHFWLSLQRPTI